MLVFWRKFKKFIGRAVSRFKSDKENPTSAKRKAAVLYATLLLCIAGMTVYIVYSFTQNFATSLTTLQTQEITEYTETSFTGYVFRNEQVLKRSDVGISVYSVTNGARVGTNDPIATFYSAAGMTEDARQDLENRLNAMTDRIEMLSGESLGNTGFAGAKDSHERTESAYISVLDSISDGNYNAAENYSNTMLKQLSRYLSITGKDSGDSESLGGLQNQKQELLSSLGSPTGSLSAENSGWFYRPESVDGYEKTFTIDKIDEMTAEEMFAFLGSASLGDNESQGIVGKMVYGADWYYAAVMPLSVCSLLNVGEEYTLTFENGLYKIKMNVHRIMIPQMTGEKGIIIFKTNVIPENFPFRRMSSASIELGSVSGYRIPNDAIYQLDNGITGVYILENSVVSFRRIIILSRGESYSIAETYEIATADGTYTEGGFGYLELNDLIIVTGGELYEGKIYY